jgi:hypothetical protein
MALQRPLKEGSVRTYQEKVGLGFTDILASEADGDSDTIYAAWNGTLGGDLSGTLPNPTIVPLAKSKWQDTGTVLTPVGAAYANKLTLDGTGNLILGGSSVQLASAAQVSSGAISGSPITQVRANTWGIAGNAAARPTWFVQLDTNADQFQVWRQAPGGGANSLAANIDLNSNLTIAGPVAVKQSGTTWVNPSDPRLKRDITPYTVGLEAILALEPISFQYNGKGGTTDDGRQCYGYDASKVRTALPECVGTRRGKLTEKDADEIDLLTLDTSNFTLALVNAVKELHARVVALEER